MFLLVSVVLLTGGGCLPQCMLGYHPLAGADTPPRSRSPRADTPSRAAPPWSMDTPPGADTPPESRHPQEQIPPRADTHPREQTPPPRADIPPTADTPQEQTSPPRGADPPWEQTPAYGQWAAGTHPTGMHSCLKKEYLSYDYEGCSDQVRYPRHSEVGYDEVSGGL